MTKRLRPLLFFSLLLAGASCDRDQSPCYYSDRGYLRGTPKTDASFSGDELNILASLYNSLAVNSELVRQAKRPGTIAIALATYDWNSEGWESEQEVPASFLKQVSQRRLVAISWKPKHRDELKCALQFLTWIDADSAMVRYEILTQPLGPGFHQRALAVRNGEKWNICGGGSGGTYN